MDDLHWKTLPVRPSGSGTGFSSISSSFRRQEHVPVRSVVGAELEHTSRIQLCKSEGICKKDESQEAGVRQQSSNERGNERHKGERESHRGSSPTGEDLR